MKPRLFLDVDGCVLIENSTTNAQGLDVPTPVPPGYLCFTYRGEDKYYNPAMAGWLQSLSKVFRIVWASHGWRGLENIALSPLFGLPDLEILEFEVAPGDHSVIYPGKLMAIQSEWDGPGAIVDDRMGPLVKDWSVNRQCILIQPDPKIGLLANYVNQLQAFGEMYGTASSKLLDSFLQRHVPEPAILKPGFVF